MRAWASCPNCSYRRNYDRQVRLQDLTNTHGGAIRRCPDCGKRVHLSIGGPVLPSKGAPGP